jgi:putative dimethyl sulfoxide reductase chaperone
MTAPVRDNDIRADFFLTMARAFTPPIGEAMQRAFVEELPDDLGAMSDRLGYPVESAIAALRGSVADFGEPMRVLQLFSALFLTPPAPVHLNTSVYLDGSVLGGSEYEMRHWFARHGLSGNGGAGALADRVDANLEFVAELFRRASRSIAAGDPMNGLAQAAEARRFLAAYPRRWLAPMRAACADACRTAGHPPVYVHLLDILAGAIDAEVVKEAATSPDVALSKAYPPGSSRGIGAPTAEDLAEIAFRLKESGLSFDHVRGRSEWRDEIFAMRCKDNGRTSGLPAVEKLG